MIESFLDHCDDAFIEPIRLIVKGATQEVPDNDSVNIDFLMGFRKLCQLMTFEDAYALTFQISTMIDSKTLPEKFKTSI